METRNFKLDTEWNVLHYPYKPNGFGILVIGDERSFVNDNSCFWTQNEGKHILLKQLKEAGYTIFYSNLYGRNWGSPKAVNHAKHLNHHIQRNEILNDKIHIIAEGMGALAALKLLQQADFPIRSMLLINPILSLRFHLEQEKEHKFFYKKLLAELADAYEIRKSNLEECLPEEKEICNYGTVVPLNIVYVLSSGNRALKQSVLLDELSAKWKHEDIAISICYMVPDKLSELPVQAVDFFQQHERFL
ncbi:hydrolase [Mesobacillus harenae]|uniref:hydrolase n=1 Tax=Mesobacillus harenae TaxID=2213203 RepID=UPI0015802207|nr:hydrolase [Mesobacillus harenae]